MYFNIEIIIGLRGYTLKIIVKIKIYTYIFKHGNVRLYRRKKQVICLKMYFASLYLTFL